MDNTDAGKEVAEEEGKNSTRPVRRQAPRWEETLAGQAKRFGDTLRHVLPMMSTDVGQIPQYFENVEHLFDIYDVPADLRSKLLIPHLSDCAKTLIGRLDVKSLDNSDELKRFLLGEFRLTTVEYKAIFDKASKRFDETHVLFASRLRNELRYYLCSRGFDDFEKLRILLVSDKLEICLFSGILHYVLSFEGEGCFQPDKVARLADTYVNYHIGTSGNRGQFSFSKREWRKFRPSIPFQDSKRGKTENPFSATGQNKDAKPNPNVVKRYWKCHSTNYLAKDSSQSRVVRPSTRYSNRRQVSACTTASSGCQAEDELVADSECNRVVCDIEYGTIANFPEINCCEDVVTQCTTKPPPELKVPPLQYVSVTVNGIKAVALCDSGSQIPIVSSRSLEVSDDQKMGTVNLQGIVGEAMTVPLVSVSVKLSGDEQCDQVMEELPLLYAVAELSSPNYDVVLPVDSVDELHNMTVVSVMRLPVTTPRDESSQVNAGARGSVVVSDVTVG